MHKYRLYSKKFYRLKNKGIGIKYIYLHGSPGRIEQLIEWFNEGGRNEEQWFRFLGFS